VRDACGVLDLPGFSRFWLQGDGADGLASAAFVPAAFPKWAA
jgi:dimethylglycine dehydrogenase